MHPNREIDVSGGLNWVKGKNDRAHKPDTPGTLGRRQRAPTLLGTLSFSLTLFRLNTFWGVRNIRVGNNPAENIRVGNIQARNIWVGIIWVGNIRVRNIRGLDAPGPDIPDPDIPGPVIPDPDFPYPPRSIQTEQSR